MIFFVFNGLKWEVAVPFVDTDSTSINKRNNHLSLQTIKHDGQQFNQYQQKEQPPLTSNH